MKRLRHDEGSIMILSLWVVALVSLLAYGVITQARLSIRQQRWEIRTANARELQLTLAQHAAQSLLQDSDPAVDSYLDPWLRPWSITSEEIQPPSTMIEPYVMRVVASDEGGKINLNVASEPLLKAILSSAGYPMAAADIAAAIMDWRDPDPTGPAEDEQESAAGLIYMPANDDFHHVEELLFVKGIDSLMVFGEDRNRNHRLDPNEDDSDASPPVDNADGQLQEGLEAYFTVYGEGEVNVNTAPQPVLTAVFITLLDDSVEAERLARAVVEKCAGSDRVHGSEDDHAFTATSELAEFLQESSSDPESVAGAYLASPFGFSSPAARLFIELSYPEQGFRVQGELLALRVDDVFQIAEWHDW